MFWFSGPHCKTSTGTQLVFLSQQPLLTGKKYCILVYPWLQMATSPLWFILNMFICRKLISPRKSVAELMDVYVIFFNYLLYSCSVLGADSSSFKIKKTICTEIIFIRKYVTCVLDWIVFCVFYLNSSRCLNKSHLF